MSKLYSSNTWKWDERVSILFTTSYTDFLQEGCEARPIQYLIKPVEQEALEKALTTNLRLNHQSCTA